MIGAFFSAGKPPALEMRFREACGRPLRMPSRFTTATRGGQERKIVKKLLLILSLAAITLSGCYAPFRGDHGDGYRQDRDRRENRDQSKERGDHDSGRGTERSNHDNGRGSQHDDRDGNH